MAIVPSVCECAIVPFYCGKLNIFFGRRLRFLCLLTRKSNVLVRHKKECYVISSSKKIEHGTTMPCSIILESQINLYGD